MPWFTKGIVYLELSGATLATHQAGKTLGMSAWLAIRRQDQAKSSVRMHLARANVMPYHTVNKIFCFLDIYVQVGQLNTLKISFIVQDARPSGGGK